MFEILVVAGLFKFRFDELLHLRPANMEISCTMAKIYIQQNKTYQLRKEDGVVITRKGTSTASSVTMMVGQLFAANIPSKSEMFPFRPNVKDNKLKRYGLQDQWAAVD